jgi:hypothetical protein
MKNGKTSKPISAILFVLASALAAWGLPPAVQSTSSLDPGGTRSGYVKTKTLADWCLLGDRSNAVFGIGYCSGYIRGAVDAMDANRILNNRPQCVPDNEQDGQLVQFFLAYNLKHHAEDADRPATWTLVLALSEVFNCEEKK